MHSHAEDEYCTLHVVMIDGTLTLANSSSTRLPSAICDVATATDASSRFVTIHPARCELQPMGTCFRPPPKHVEGQPVACFLCSFSDLQAYSFQGD